MGGDGYEVFGKGAFASHGSENVTNRIGKRAWNKAKICIICKQISYFPYLPLSSAIFPLAIIEMGTVFVV
jgi:hypothetical protein